MAQDLSFTIPESQKMEKRCINHRATMEEIGPSSAPGHPCPPKKHYQLPYSLSQESLLHQKA